MLKAAGRWTLDWVVKQIDIAAATVLLLVICIVLITQSMSLNQGQLIYALDDAYIHLAVAKNLVQTGTWGVLPGAFSTATSSLAWPLLQAAMFIVFGVHTWIPLLLALVSGGVLLSIASRMLTKAGVPLLWRSCALVFIVWATPIPTLVLSGMEHLLHAVVTLVFVSLAATSFSDVENGQNARSARGTWAIALSAMAMVSLRFEGLFMVGIVAGVYLVRRQINRAIGLLAGGLLPVLAFGTLSSVKGFFFLPNSVLLKSSTAVSLSFLSLQQILVGWYGRIMYHPELLLLVTFSAIVLLVSYVTHQEGCSYSQSSSLLFIAAVLAHALFAEMGWLFRYEAYLVALGVVTLTPHLYRWIPEISFTDARRHSSLFMRYLLLVLLFVPLLVRGGQAVSRVVTATNNIFCQHLQMARFVKQYDSSATLAINDIGAVSFFTENPFVDLSGLADHEVAIARLSKTYDSTWLGDLARRRGVKIAMLYESSLGGGIPPGWQGIGKWRIDNNVVCADDTILFFAVAPQDRGKLAQSLVEFSKGLPPHIHFRPLSP